MRHCVILVLAMTAAMPASGRTEILDDFTTPPPSSADAAARASTPTGRRIMLIGDSIQAGTNLERTTNQASYRLQKSGRVIIHNFSSPGATMADPVPGFFPGMNHATTAIQLLHGFFRMYGLIVNLGINDYGQQTITLEAFRDAYASLLDSVPATVRIACVSPTWSLGEEDTVDSHGDTKDDYRDAVREVCEAHGGAYLEGEDAIPHSLAYFPDGLHPNDRGHKMMGKFLLRALDELGWLS